MKKIKRCEACSKGHTKSAFTCSRECSNQRFINIANARTKKPCGKCKKVLPVSKFFIRTFKKDRTLYQSYCKVCHTKTVKEWQEKNPEKTIISLRKAALKYRAKNKEKINAYQRNRWRTSAEFRARSNRNRVNHYHRNKKSDR